MDYRYLKAFLSTAKHSSFSKAANELKIAQSAVSRQIKLLEETLNEELIIRSSKKVLLTSKGTEFYKAAQNFDRLAQEIFDREDTHPIKIGILHGLLKYWFTPILIKFLKRNSRNIVVSVADHPVLKKGIENGKYDIIFSTDNIQSELISSLKLFEEKLVLISKKEIDRKKLHEYTWVVYGPQDILYKYSKQVSKNIIQIDNIDMIVDLVRGQVGIAIVPEHCFRKTEGLNIHRINSLEKSEIFMTTLNFKSMPKHIKEMTSLVITK